MPITITDDTGDVAEENPMLKFQTPPSPQRTQARQVVASCPLVPDSDAVTYTGANGALVL